MKCQEANDNMYGYCDNVIALDLSTLITQHINDCADCRRNYQLTLQENAVLRNIEDIPPLAPTFSSNIISTLAEYNLDNNPQLNNCHNISLPKRFGWATAISAVIALCIYLPNLFGIGNINLADQSATVSQTNPSSLKMDTLNNEAVIRIPQGLSTSTTLNEQNKSITPESTITMTEASSAAKGANLALPDTTNYGDAANISPQNTSPTVISLQSKSTTQTSTVIALNMPEIYKLGKINNMDKGKTIYNYISLDGKVNLKLTVVPYSNDTTIAFDSRSSLQSEASSSIIYQMGTKQITVNLAGNLPIEDLNQLLNSLQFSEN